MANILCSIATRGRYDTTLPMALQAVINQTRLPDRLVIFDDNDNPVDLRDKPIYRHLFNILDCKKIPWEVLFAEKKGQHFIHQTANTMEYEWVWRVDDDCLPEPDVLETLEAYISPDVGAVGGAILTPPLMDTSRSTGHIDLIDSEPNIQWGYIRHPTPVQHLHCSFIYRAGVHDYCLGLSRVAHREETLFTWGLYQKGYKILAVPGADSWHLKSPTGGIRSENKAEMYAHDEYIYRNFLARAGKTIVVLDSGMGDHIVFSHVLPDVKNPEVYTCYPDIVPGRSIAEAYNLFGSIDQFNIYRKMAEWRWSDSLENAYRKLYT